MADANRTAKIVIASTIGIFVIAYLLSPNNDHATPPSSDQSSTTQSSELSDNPEKPDLVTSGKTLTVQMQIAIAAPNPLTVVGTTNLPDETPITVWLKGEMPTCLPHCGYEFKSTNVKGGKFTATLDYDRQLVPDAYTVDVVSGPANLSPTEVQFVIGKAGGNLRGPYIVTVENGNYVPADFSPNHMPTKDQALFGFLVHFTQRIQITEDGEAGLVPCSGQSEGSGIDCGLATALSPPVTASAQPEKPAENIDKAYTECLMREGQSPEFTSSDGGHSAMMLTQNCEKEWNAVIDACMKRGDSDGDCTMKSVAISQMTLKMLGK
ncbi:MAG: hypothetical protein WDM89_17275 [Rhizomicrobium sp.]